MTCQANIRSGKVNLGKWRLPSALDVLDRGHMYVCTYVTEHIISRYDDL